MNDNEAMTDAPALTPEATEPEAASLPRWKCHKVVEAFKIGKIDGNRLHAENGQHVVEVTPAFRQKHVTCQEGGYYVRYEDGYCSYSPAKAFEAGYTPAPVIEPTGVDFGTALQILKEGGRVRRAGWNGKGMFLFLLPEGQGIPTRVITDPALKAVIEQEVGGETFDALGSIRMFTADKKILTGWLASQTDMLSEDWEVL